MLFSDDAVALLQQTSRGIPPDYQGLGRRTPGILNRRFGTEEAR
jgi:hypothetical protein